MTEAWALVALEGKTVSGGKGADTANAQREQELAMQTQAFQQQMSMLNNLQSAFSKYMTGNIGFDPGTLAQMKTQFLNSNANTFNQAGQQVREALDRLRLEPFAGDRLAVDEHGRCCARAEDQERNPEPAAPDLCVVSIRLSAGRPWRASAA